MLHRGAPLYKAQRNDDLLKFKAFEDAEARVIASIPGKGKYAGKTGPLLVEPRDSAGQPAQRFKLGIGLKDAQRSNPPAVGTMVTFRFRGLNDSGIPRFASFMQVRDDYPTLSTYTVGIVVFLAVYPLFFHQPVNVGLKPWALGVEFA